jgi:hypothetical protein
MISSARDGASAAKRLSALSSVAELALVAHLQVERALVGHAGAGHHVVERACVR